MCISTFIQFHFSPLYTRARTHKSVAVCVVDVMHLVTDAHGFEAVYANVLKTGDRRECMRLVYGVICLFVTAAVDNKYHIVSVSISVLLESRCVVV